MVYETIFPKEELSEIIYNLPPEVVIDVRSFRRVANSVVSMARSCNPSLVREVAKFEKYRKNLVDVIKRAMMSGAIPSDVGRKAVRYINNYYDDILKQAEKELDVCLKP